MAVTADRVIQMRINGRVKDEAAAVLAAIGLTVSDAVRLMLMKIAQEKALPFDPLIPNETTLAAMRAARAGELEPVTLEQIKAEIEAAQAQ
jgi:DNA-damage-inducible protein J